MKKFFSHKKDDKEHNQEQFSDEPPSYEQSEDIHNNNNNSNNSDVPSYSGNYRPNEYPEEKKGAFEGQNSQSFQNPGTGNWGYGHAQPPPGTYTYAVPPQKTNIAYETDGRHTRPGYAEYIATDNERVARGDGPLPREAFGSQKGAPLAPSKKNQGSSGGFPGASGPSGPTYFNASRE